mgnify:CR=1 FL=1
MCAFLKGNDGAKTFSDLLLTIGNGTVITCDRHDVVNIPDGLCHVVASMEEMKLRVSLTSARDEWNEFRLVVRARHPVALEQDSVRSEQLPPE